MYNVEEAIYSRKKNVSSSFTHSKKRSDDASDAVSTKNFVQWESYGLSHYILGDGEYGKRDFIEIHMASKSNSIFGGKKGGLMCDRSETVLGI